MATHDPTSEDLRDRGFSELVKDLASQTSTLVRQEIKLAQAEVTQQGKLAGKGASMLAGAAVAALLGLGALTALLIVALDGFMPLWLAALIVTVLWLAVAAALATAGRSALQAATPPVPQTVETVKEDIQWAKTQNRIRREIEQTRAEMGETVDALGYKTDVKARTKDRVTGVKDRVVGATPDTGDVKHQARRAKSVAEENPLGLAVGALAVGFLAGMLIPSTRVEDEKMGQASDDRGRPHQGDRAGGARARQAGRAGRRADRSGERPRARRGSQDHRRRTTRRKRRAARAGARVRAGGRARASPRPAPPARARRRPR